MRWKRPRRCSGSALRDQFYVDEFYGIDLHCLLSAGGRASDLMDRRVWGGVVAGL